MNISQIYFFAIRQKQCGTIMESVGADKRNPLFEFVFKVKRGSFFKPFS